MYPGKAFLGGAIGGVILTLLMAVARSAGLGVNIEMTLGSLLTMNIDVGTWLLGFIIHVVLSGLIGLAYAFVFERVTHRATWALGVAVGAVHAIIAGLVMGMLPAIHPLIPESEPAPGLFLVNVGLVAAVSFVALHLVFGAIVGAFYRPVRHPAPSF